MATRVAYRRNSSVLAVRNEKMTSKNWKARVDKRDLRPISWQHQLAAIEDPKPQELLFDWLIFSKPIIKLVPVQFIMYIFILLWIISLIACILANPVPNADVKLVKRLKEGIHLVACGNFYTAANVRTSIPSSAQKMTAEQFCPDDGNCNFIPDPANQCLRTSNEPWEGKRRYCTFPTGVKYSYDIRADAQSRPDLTKVGWADLLNQTLPARYLPPFFFFFFFFFSCMCFAVGIDIVQCGRRNGTNGYHAFIIFKDDKHVMYIDQYGLECRSIYYCLDVSFSH